jgi:hypothetical protein
MKKTLLSICIIILFLSLGLTPVSAFKIETNNKQFVSNENSPAGIDDLFVTVNLGTYIIEMKESGQDHDVDQYPYTFDTDTSQLSKPTIKIEKLFKNSIWVFPSLQPEIDIVFIDNRSIHPAYNISIVFFSSGTGPLGIDFWDVLKVMVDENQIGEVRKTMGISNTTEGFSPWPWQDKTYYPKIDVHNKSIDLDYYHVTNLNELDRRYKESLIHTDLAEFNVDVTTKQKEIQHIWSFPFLNLLKNIFKNKFSSLFL